MYRATDVRTPGNCSNFPPVASSRKRTSCSEFLSQRSAPNEIGPSLTSTTICHYLSFSQLALSGDELSETVAWTSTPRHWYAVNLKTTSLIRLLFASSRALHSTFAARYLAPSQGGDEQRSGRWEPCDPDFHMPAISTWDFVATWRPRWRRDSFKSRRAEQIPAHSGSLGS